MLRSDIVRGVKNILLAFDESKIRPLLDNVYARNKTDKIDLQSVIISYQTYMTIYQTKFTKVEKDILGIMGLEIFNSNKWWSEAIGLVSNLKPDGNRNDIITIFSRPYTSLRFAMEQLPKITGLLTRSSDPTETYLSNETSPDLNEKNRIILILPEIGGKLSSPERIVLAIESIILLYKILADINSVPSSDLVMASCDSGSDKLFDFSGLGEVVEKTKDLLLEVWSNAIYFKEKKHVEQLDAINKSLSILGTIKELEEKNSIDRETAELFRRGVTNGVSKFIESGAHIPEMIGKSEFSPRLLLPAKSTLLLSGPENSQNKSSEEKQSHSESINNGDDQTNVEESDNNDDLTEDEKKELEQEIIKRRKNKG